jgi:hypothetical protein
MPWAMEAALFVSDRSDMASKTMSSPLLEWMRK